MAENIRKIVLVSCFPSSDRQIKEISGILTKLRQLTRDGEKVWLVQISYSDEAINVENVKNLGADYVLVEQLNDNCIYNTYEILAILQKGLKKYGWNTFMFTDDLLSKQIAGMFSTYSGAAYIADCIDIETNSDGIWRYMRTALNDSCIAQIVSVNTNIEACVIKSNVFQECSSFYDAQILYDDATNVVDIPPNYISLLKSEKKQISDKRIYDSECIFCVGRGLKNTDWVLLMEKTAELCGAQICVSRPVAQETKKFYQIGQSGISVAPNIYVAFGISGATQHIAGITKAKTIIAINTNPNARIFQYADYIVVHDAQQILEDLYELCSDELKTQKL